MDKSELVKTLKEKARELNELLLLAAKMRLIVKPSLDYQRQILPTPDFELLSIKVFEEIK